MSTLFGSAPKPPKLPSVQPQNPAMDAQAQAAAQRRGTQAAVTTTTTPNTAPSGRATVFGG